MTIIYLTNHSTSKLFNFEDTDYQDSKSYKKSNTCGNLCPYLKNHRDTTNSYVNGIDIQISNKIKN